MKIKREISDSLELLLDTMCNTFGGVIFIALTLSLLLMLQDNTRNRIQLEESPEQQLQRLEKQLEALDKLTLEKLAELEIAANDPRRKAGVKLLKLQERQAQLELKLKARQLRIQQQQTTLEQLEALKREREVELERLTQQLQTLEALNKSRRQEIEALKRQLRPDGDGAPLHNFN